MQSQLPPLPEWHHVHLNRSCPNWVGMHEMYVNPADEHEFWQEFDDVQQEPGHCTCVQ